MSILESITNFISDKYEQIKYNKTTISDKSEKEKTDFLKRSVLIFGKDEVDGFLMRISNKGLIKNIYEEVENEKETGKEKQTFWNLAEKGMYYVCRNTPEDRKHVFLKFFFEDGHGGIDDHNYECVLTEEGGYKLLNTERVLDACSFLMEHQKEEDIVYAKNDKERAAKIVEELGL